MNRRSFIWGTVGALVAAPLAWLGWSKRPVEPSWSYSPAWHRKRAEARAATLRPTGVGSSIRVTLGDGPDPSTLSVKGHQLVPESLAPDGFMLRLDGPEFTGKTQ